GTLLQRKNDNLEASSRPLMRYAWFGAAFEGSRSMRNRNSGLTSKRLSARSIPTSKLPFARPSWYIAIRGLMSASVTGRRYARRASTERIRPAHLVSSEAAAGRQTKIRPLLAESPGPVGEYGPAISTLRRWIPNRVSGVLTAAGYGRRNGSRAVSASADVILKNAMLTSRSPAFTRTRTSQLSSAWFRFSRSSGLTRKPASFWEFCGR